MGVTRCLLSSLFLLLLFLSSTTSDAVSTPWVAKASCRVDAASSSDRSSSSSSSSSSPEARRNLCTPLSSLVSFREWVEYDDDRCLKRLKGEIQYTPLHIVYINLERREDRRKGMEKMLGVVRKAFGGFPLCVGRMVAVDGRGEVSDPQLHFAVSAALKQNLHYNNSATNSATITHDGAGTLLKFHPSITQGVIGCALSHRKVWKHMVASRIEEPLVILEDDLSWITPKIDQVFKGLFMENGNSMEGIVYDVLYVSYHGCHRSVAAAKKVGVQKRLKVEPCGDVWFSGLFTYVVNGWGAAAKLLTAWPLEAQIDKHIALLCQSGRLVCYRVQRGRCPTFTPLSEATLDSDVQTFREE